MMIIIILLYHNIMLCKINVSIVSLNFKTIYKKKLFSLDNVEILFSVKSKFIFNKNIF